MAVAQFKATASITSFLPLGTAIRFLRGQVPPRTVSSGSQGYFGAFFCFGILICEIHTLSLKITVFTPFPAKPTCVLVKMPDGLESACPGKSSCPWGLCVASKGITPKGCSWNKNLRTG